MPGFRVGTELSDRAKFWGRVGGIFHTDEMPVYGVTAEEVETLRKVANASEDDAVVFVADTAENMQDALKAVVQRAQEALEGVPSETRTSKEDGTTRYMRPRPGAARMYPETDIPPLAITSGFLEKIRSNLPEPAEKKLKRLMQEYGLNDKLANQIVNSECEGLFEVVIKESKVVATTVAVFLTETLKSLRRDGVMVEKVTEDQIMEIFRSVGSGALVKEALADVFVWLSENSGESLQAAVDALELEMISRAELAKLVDRVIAENRQLVNQMGEKALGMLMGIVMKEVRGKANPSVVSALLRERLK
jgi:glutamyl-tRNA(Gln) amidotransferase subunit E